MGKFPHSPRVSHYDRFKFLQKFAEIFASQGAPAVSTTPVAKLPPVSTTLAANWPPVSLVLLILVANLPPVSMIPEATCHWFQGRRWQICHQYQRHRWQICQRCQQHWWQNMETISGCTLPKVNLKAKIYIYVNSTTQRCPNKIIKIFQIEDYFPLPPVSRTPMVNLEPQISLRIFEKNWNGRNGILRCLGETDSGKNPKISWHCPFKVVVKSCPSDIRK